jgi:hypothetical protein
VSALLVAIVPAAPAIVAVIVHQLLLPRVVAGRLPATRASVILLASLIAAPPAAALMLYCVGLAVGGETWTAAARALPVATYAAYSIGFVCFIVASRRFQRAR